MASSWRRRAWWFVVVCAWGMIASLTLANRALFTPWLERFAAQINLTRSATAKSALDEDAHGSHDSHGTHDSHTSSSATRSRSAARVPSVELSLPAQRNLQLSSEPLKLQNYWKSHLIPGEFVDRPGVSDRGITAPVTGVVVQVHAFPGDRVEVGDRLFTLRLTSEYLQNTQAELFRAHRETELIQAQRNRLTKAAEGGAIAQSRLIELDQQIQRQQAFIVGYRQDLIARGLQPEQLDQVARGQFVTTLDVAAGNALGGSEATDEQYEMQSLNVELGSQVQAGQLLATLSNHRELYIRGHAFKREAPQLERAAREGWPISVEFAEDDPQSWPALTERLEIRHLANSVDEATRTFAFFIPISNQSHRYEKQGQPFTVWRFRPGQRVRLFVPMEQFQDVFVVPQSAVVRDGAEAYLFRQNGDRFYRYSVQVLHEDRKSMVVAPDSGIRPGWHVVQNNAAALHRILQSQAGTHEPAGVHVHADGTVHGAH